MRDVGRAKAILMHVIALLNGLLLTNEKCHSMASLFALKTKRLAIDIDVDHRQITAYAFAVSTILSRLLSCLDSTDSPL